MRKEEPDGFIVHALYHKRLLDLDDETLGTVFRNLILFYNGRDLEPATEGADMLIKILCDHIEKDVNAYVERCRINRENIKKRYEKRYKRRMHTASRCACILNALYISSEGWNIS